MEVNNQVANSKLGWWGILITFVGAGAETARRYLRKNGQKDLQKQVDDSQPSPFIEDLDIDKSCVQIYNVNKDGVDLSKFETISDDEANEWKAFVSTFGSETLKTSITTSSFSGLLKCDIPLKDLYRIKDNPGLMKGYVIKDGKFYKQATFSEANISNAAPLLIFQCLSAVTSQYYQQVLAERLSEIENKLDNMMEELIADDRAKLKTAYNRFVMLIGKESYDIADKNNVSESSRMVEVVRWKYRDLLNKIDLAVDWKGSDKKEAESKIQKLNDSRYFEYLELAMQAESLFYMALAISVRVAKYLGNNEDVKMYAKSMNLDFWGYYANQFQRIRHDVLKYLELVAKSSWMQGNSIKALRDKQVKCFNSIEMNMLNIQKQFDFLTTQYIQFEEDGSMKKYITLNKTQ